MTTVTVSSGRCPFAGVALACRDAATTSRSAMRRTLLPLLLCCLLPLSACAQAPAFPLEPDEARLVTEDIDRFWQAWDEAADATDAEARARIFQARYLEPGSPGLETFVRLRIGDAGKLVAAIDAHPRYYASLRRLTPKLEDQVPRIRDTLRRMRTLVPDAVFPDVYFLVGRMNSGGTADATGLMIGVEMFGRAPGTPLDELGDWHRAVVGEFDNLPAIVAHEWVHFQQRARIDGQPTLLQAAIGEGVADFIAELGAGRHINDHVHAWAEPRAAALWQEFGARMHGTDYAGWLYEGANARGDRPADLGYWIGYRIARAYYERADDKPAALREMLDIQDFDAFLAASGIDRELGGD